MRTIPVLSPLFLVTFLHLAGCGSGAVSDDDLISLDSTTEGGSTTSFSARLMERKSSVNQMGIVLLHGRGGNPDSAVVQQLRYDLYDRGYTTLSIQCPVPSGYSEGGASAPPFNNYVTEAATVFPETYARIRTAIDRLASSGHTQVILIGFSLGSRMVSAHVAHGVDDELPIVGMVGIGMYTGGGDPLTTDTTLDEVGANNIPVLDIYGDLDNGAALTATTRLTTYTDAGGSNYTQTVLDCTGVGVTGNDCHKLIGLKGASTSPLEISVSDWIAGL